MCVAICVPMSAQLPSSGVSVTMSAMCAEASKAGEPLAELQQERKQLWLQCLSLAAILSELRAQGEDVRSRAAGHVQLLAARQLLGDAAGDGGGVGEEEGGGAGAARAGTVEEVRRMVTEAHDALKEWEKAASEQRCHLQRTTDKAAAALEPEVSAKCLPGLALTQLLLHLVRGECLTSVESRDT